MLDACVNNSGKVFHLEVASRDFENEYVKIISKGHPLVVQKLKESLKRWAEEEFKTDAQLILIPTLYTKLLQKGIDFTVEAVNSLNVLCGPTFNSFHFSLLRKQLQSVRTLM